MAPGTPREGRGGVLLQVELPTYLGFLTPRAGHPPVWCGVVWCGVGWGGVGWGGVGWVWCEGGLGVVVVGAGWWWVLGGGGCVVVVGAWWWWVRGGWCVVGGGGWWRWLWAIGGRGGGAERTAPNHVYR